MSTSASQTFTSGQNEVMGILIGRVKRAAFTLAGNQRAGERFPLPQRPIFVLQSPHDEIPDGRARFLRLPAQPLMQGLRNFECGVHRHNLIMTSEASPGGGTRPYATI